VLCLAKEAARHLKAVYGEHLLEVVLFGSWVRGEAHEESDVDLTWSWTHAARTRHFRSLRLAR